jgi:asparagine synthase (glutamine-hydrolysing)
LEKKQKKIKVLISGLGADEMWGGYQRHTAFDFYLKQKGILLPIKDSVKKLSLNRQ